MREREDSFWCATKRVLSRIAVDDCLQLPETGPCLRNTQCFCLCNEAPNLGQGLSCPDSMDLTIWQAATSRLPWVHQWGELPFWLHGDCILEDKKEEQQTTGGTKKLFQCRGSCLLFVRKHTDNGLCHRPSSWSRQMVSWGMWTSRWWLTWQKWSCRCRCSDDHVKRGEWQRISKGSVLKFFGTHIPILTHLWGNLAQWRGEVDIA